MTRLRNRLCGFRPAAAQSDLSRPIASGINVAEECCDRWCGADRVALRWAGDQGQREDWTFEQLRDASSRLANLLASHGIVAGDRIAGLLPAHPDAAHHNSRGVAPRRGASAAVHRFRAQGDRAPPPGRGYARRHYRPSQPPELAGIAHDALILVTEPAAAGEASDIDLGAALEAQSPDFVPVQRSAEEPFLIMFTSGTTGAPKSLTVPLKAIAAFAAYMRDAVGLEPGDNFWNVADPGWAYGLYYAVTGPLALGHTTHFYSGAFTAGARSR